MKMQIDDARKDIDWPTLGICGLCYLGVGVSTAWAQDLGMIVSGAILTLALTLYSSFNHEVLHGHPFRNEAANTFLVFPAWGVLLPYPRFRDTHLAHHHDPSLTDPYDDPETNFVDPKVWEQWSSTRRGLYRWNNTLFGRMMIGPLIGLLSFYANDVKAVLSGDRRVAHAYLFHGAGLVPVFLWLGTVSEMPLWLYGVAIYASNSILRIRTFLEHRAHEKARCRSVIIEDRGLLSLLFLKNNLHAVHHACPSLPWYRLESHFAVQRSRFLRRNGGYVYRSYAQIARLYLFRAKDSVPHTIWSPDRTAAAKELPHIITESHVS